MCILVGLMTIQCLLFGIKLEWQGKIKLSDKKALLLIPINFCVTEDEVFLITDFKDGNVKIYKNTGELASILGSRGFGPNEFGQVFASCYSDKQFLVSDLGQRKTFFYERKGRYEFKRINRTFKFMGERMQLDGSRLFTSHRAQVYNNVPYDFIMIDIGKNNSYTYLLPTVVKHGLQSVKEYDEPSIRGKLATIGFEGYFALSGDFAYYVWMGDLKIFKINLKTKEISTFGKKTPLYVKPDASKKLLEAFSNRDIPRMNELRSKMSYITDIFTTQKYVAVSYMIYKEKLLNVLQFYTLNGQFVQEIQIGENIRSSLVFDKKRNILYSIIGENEGEENESYSIIKYKIID